METSKPSGLPSHLETLSASVPVGHTETQAPQNSHPASTWLLPKAGPIWVFGPRYLKASTEVPRTSWHIRTQRPHRMQML